MLWCQRKKHKKANVPPCKDESESTRKTTNIKLILVPSMRLVSTTGGRLMAIPLQWEASEATWRRRGEILALAITLPIRIRIVSKVINDILNVMVCLVLSALE